MLLHNKAFWSISFFLIGVLLASFINGWQERFLVAGFAAIFIACIFMVFQKYWLGALSLAIMLGSGYYFIFDFYQGLVLIPFDEKTAVTGIVQQSSTGLEKQDVIIALSAPYSGRIKATTQVYPTWRYGDRLSLEGVIKRPREESKNYLAKEGVFGTIGLRLRILPKRQSLKSYLRSAPLFFPGLCWATPQSFPKNSVRK